MQNDEKLCEMILTWKRRNIVQHTKMFQMIQQHEWPVQSLQCQLLLWWWQTLKVDVLTLLPPLLACCSDLSEKDFQSTKKYQHKNELQKSQLWYGDILVHLQVKTILLRSVLIQYIYVHICKYQMYKKHITYHHTNLYMSMLDTIDFHKSYDLCKTQLPQRSSICVAKALAPKSQKYCLEPYVSEAKG